MSKHSELTQTKTLPPDRSKRPYMPLTAAQSGEALPPPLHQAQSRKKGVPAWLGAVFVLIAFGLIWFAWNDGKVAGSAEQASKNPKDIKKIERVVNKHLIMTNKKIELEQERARLEHLTTNPSIGDQILPRHKPHPQYGVDHSSDRNEMNAVRDLDRTGELDISSPDAIIQSELADRDASAESERRYHDEYARQFIANARAAGYDIELDENFVVKRVRKLKPAEKGLFDGRPSVAH